MRDLLRGLTLAQREAVEHVDGPLLILAGPGSGKTRVVTHRIAHLIGQGIPPAQILGLTFTNKAADEMRSRVELLAPGRPVRLSTFHRFCARLLREYAPLVGLRENYTIYDTSDSLQALKRTIDDLGVDATHFTPGQIAAAISTAKNKLVTADQYVPRAGGPLPSIVARVYPVYQSRLLSASAVDFDDLLVHVAVLLRDNPEVRAELDARNRYVLVDEYQDTNLAQYMIVRGLSVDYPNLAVTGDPDQSIYGWRGANLNNILDFEKDYPGVRVVRLEQNYRSTKRILSVAARLIANNRRRKAKDLFTDNAEGAPVRFHQHASEKSEADTIVAGIAEAIRAGRRRPRDFAVFYRTNALSRALEFALREHGLPYQIVNGVEFYQRKEIKDILAYLLLINNPRDDVAFLRVINTPHRGIGRTTVQRLMRHATQYGTTLLEAARESGLVEDLPKKTAVTVARFVAMFDRLNAVATGPVEEILGHVLSETKYREPLVQSESEEDQERLANIEELLTAARQFDERHAGDAHLAEFLEEACLVNDTDAWDTEIDRVTLMTLHASKGLEFPVVHVIALEEGLIPHERSRNQPDELEEERRLLFVGFTRAQEELHLSLARYREFRGQRKMTVPSQFLLELPTDELETTTEAWVEPVGAALAESTESGYPSAWDMDDSAVDASPELDADRAPRGRRPVGPAWQATPLKTAAEMLLGPATAAADVMAEALAPVPEISPDDFALGMLVRHPEYGLGKIMALSGSGPRRTATIAFAAIGGQKKFILRQSALRPARR
ncbi:MAG: UvrD-helicase domain-containing protein [Planctomycetia bacterium]|nr:UvrD-helicase domain-containing protein [Planctomycetia bacterium]